MQLIIRQKPNTFIRKNAVYLIRFKSCETEHADLISNVLPVMF